MITAILIILIVLLILLLGVMTGMNFRNVNIANFWFAEWQNSEKNYKALEQGRDEESEAYEQQYLSFQEIISNQSTAIDSYIEDLHFLVGIVRTHMDDCLPIVQGDMEQRERFLKIEQGILLQTDG